MNESEFAAFALNEARHGNPGPLIGRLRFFLMLKRGEQPSAGASELVATDGADVAPPVLCGGVILSEGEIAFIVEALEATIGKRGHDAVREVEKSLIAEQVKQGVPRKVVAKQRNLSLRTVATAIKDRRGR